MSEENFIKILLACASAAVGAILGVLRSKIFSSKSPNGLHYFFLIFAGLSILFSLVFSFFLRDSFFNHDNTFGVVVLIITVLFNGVLIWATFKFLRFKNVFTIPELNVRINKFTDDADRDEIKLFGGDLNFLGDTPAEINKNVQYQKLLAKNFTRIYILCETPIRKDTKRRYGKILSDMPEVQLGFYNPESTDLKVRGRIIKLNGVNRLLMYTKVRDGVYQAIYTDTADSNGVLYTNIWSLIWDMSSKPTPEAIANYKSLI